MGLRDWFKKRSVEINGDADKSAIQTGNNNVIMQGIPVEVYLAETAKVEALLKELAQKSQAEQIMQSFLTIIGKNHISVADRAKVLTQIGLHYRDLAITTESLSQVAYYQHDIHLIELVTTAKHHLANCAYVKLENSLLAMTKTDVRFNHAKPHHQLEVVEANHALASLNRLLLNRIEAEGYSYQAMNALAGDERYQTTMMRYLEEAADHFKQKGCYREAILLYGRLVLLAKKIFPAESTELARHFNNLATLYDSQGRYEDALPLYQRSLAIRQKTLGENHPDTGMSYGNLAGVLEAIGNYDDALLYRKKALENHENSLGKEHPITATSLNNLAGLYYSQGRVEEALPLYQRSLAIREKTLGENHPDVATSLNNLAELYRNQGRYEEALPLYQRALAIFEKSLGAEHPTTKIVARNYAGLLGKMSEL